jgi:hypothetical protein
MENLSDIKNLEAVVTHLKKELAEVKNQGSGFRNATSFSYSPGYTFPGNLPTELYYAPTPGTPALSDIFTIRQGIRTDEYLVLVNYLDKILSATTGCSPSYTTAGTLSDRKITVGKFSANLQWCKSDFISTASALSNDPKFVADGLDGYEVTAAVRKMWVDTMVDAMRRDIFRLAFLANDSSPSTFWNVIDGLMVKLYDANASYCVKRVSNSFGNNQNTVLAADEALAVFQSLFRNSQIPLMQLPASEKVFWCTGAVYANLLESYQSSTRSGSEAQFRTLTNGESQLMFNGIEVRPLWMLDSVLANDTTCPWYGNIRNLIIYTPKASSRYSNLVLGTEKASDLDRVDVFYDQRLLTTFAQAEVRFGVNFINCDLTSFAD